MYIVWRGRRGFDGTWKFLLKFFKNSRFTKSVRSPYKIYFFSSDFRIITDVFNPQRYLCKSINQQLVKICEKNEKKKWINFYLRKGLKVSFLPNSTPRFLLQRVFIQMHFLKLNLLWIKKKKLYFSFTFGHFFFFFNIVPVSF